jgi:hypothetical protein
MPPPLLLLLPYYFCLSMSFDFPSDIDVTDVGYILSKYFRDSFRKFCRHESKKKRYKVRYNPIFFRFHRRANNNKRNQEQPRRTIFFFSYLNGGEGGNNGRAAESMSDEREMRQMTLNVRLQDNLRPRVA